MTTIEKIKYLTSAALAVVLALSMTLQVGFVSINTMSCESTGALKVAVGEFEDCCALDAEDFGIKKSACCDFQSVSKTFNLFSYDVDQDFDFVAVVSNGPRTSNFDSYAEEQITLPPSTGPPISSGRDLLISISKWTI